ncbi:HvfC/BufC family peptide modification chaperone [Desertibaculum subflavum]|uniref:HvfC/BufC family peptide modification chaperone n=1 Tax=Desertibaculum subflavum TaxID=2268458 RepID=UPI000E67009C
MTAGAETALAGLQRDFQDYLLGRPHEMLARVRSTAKADAATLLDVYGAAYVLRLVEVLENDFPGLRAWIGPERFDALARAYIAAHPSDHANARWFGRHLPGFVRQAAPWSGECAIRDLAALDWAVGEAFDAAESDLVTFADMAGQPPEAWPGLRFAVVPSVRRLDLKTNADAIRRAATAGEALPEIEPAPRALAVWRRGLETEILDLEPDALVAFDALAAGEPFARICERLGDFHPEEMAAVRAAGLLRAWIELDLIAVVTAEG